MNSEIMRFSESSLDVMANEPVCGIVMPIAAMADYPASHWLEVQTIIKEALNIAGYKARLVSESEDANVIIGSIVQNVYSDEIVVCDVSGMNPNVMFELGMRLAFDKPVVIIKDESTRFSFDISTIEHLEYPRSLRYQSIRAFKTKLAEKIKNTVSASRKENYRSFLSNFGSFTVANLKDTTLNESEALERILNKLDKVDTRLVELESTNKGHRNYCTDYEDSLILESLYDGKSSPYRIIFEKSIDVMSAENFEKMSSAIYRLYGDSVKITLRSSPESTKLRVLTNVSLESEEKVIRSFMKEFEKLEN